MIEGRNRFGSFSEMTASTALLGWPVELWFEDIADRDSARPNARMYEELAKEFGLVLFTADAKGRWTALSEAWTVLTGRSVEASLGRAMVESLIMEDRRKAVRDLAPLREGRLDKHRFQARYRAADGRARWVSIQVGAVRGEAGAFLGTRGFITDVRDGGEIAPYAAPTGTDYKLLVDHSDDMIVQFGLDGTRHYVSPACRPLLGYAPEELIGLTPAAAIHVEDRARVIGCCQSLLAGESAPICVYRQCRKDGSWAWLEASYRLVRHPTTDVPVGFIAWVRDVSRRQAAELVAAEASARLHENHRLLAMAEAVAQFGHWRLDVAGRDLFWSPEVKRIYGVPADYRPGYTDGLAAYHPADRKCVTAHVRRALDHGTAFVFTARLVSRSGEVRHVATRGQAEIAPDGAVTGLFGVMQDVTAQIEAEQALRDSEARYRLLADNATDVIFRFSREGRFTYVSPSIMMVNGYPPDAIVGIDPSEAFHHEDRAGVFHALEALWTGKAERISVEYRMRNADGSWLWMEASGQVASHEGVPEIVGVSRNISKRKQIEDELRQARGIAERAADEARALVEVDELTGVASRRQFHAVLDRALAVGAERPLAVAIFDIDHFKRVNDEHGHAAGDLSLQQVAKAASGAVRGGDLIGRLGGEEFAILMPGVSASVAKLVSERVRAMVEAAAPPGGGPAVTISVGVASRQAGQTAAELLARADEALYTAKRSGRNRVNEARPG